jgi:hypothetical protein
MLGYFGVLIRSSVGGESQCETCYYDKCRIIVLCFTHTQNTHTHARHTVHVCICYLTERFSIRRVTPTNVIARLDSELVSPEIYGLADRYTLEIDRCYVTQ